MAKRKFKVGDQVAWLPDNLMLNNGLTVEQKARKHKAELGFISEVRAFGLVWVHFWSRKSKKNSGRKDLTSDTMYTGACIGSENLIHYDLVEPKVIKKVLAELGEPL